ncbi:MAG: class I SAM-dependent methyltransferase [Kofleriaceae bacterium]|nr:class I SAM-dependent methyltransferase [Kofleriaceae bacterium]
MPMSLQEWPQIETIRPRIVFEALERKFPDVPQKFSVAIPPSGIGGLLLLESSILVAFLRLLDAQRIFEFGTFLGATAVLLAENSDASARVCSLDLKRDSLQLSLSDNPDLQDAEENDEFLRGEYKTQGPHFVSKSEPKTRSKIKLVEANSNDYEIAEDERGVYDLVFIDGGHDWATIENDTKKALLLAKEDAVILWHDFTSEIHTEVTSYLGEFSKTTPVIHIGSTMLGLHLRGRCASLLSPSA